ncbi:VWA domain-containing protein [Meiothermus sp.]|uniref:vWA domain-containing protein n=1 Tax=Meiothermus sp. TaxID=1955249 RepID=UPI0021DBD00C|nr:VWA domain-containing protein [Meiothermus sp.]GIW35247.1 MAG: hypothetical protein KatS3mg072_2580 [Meiothermus sp.]
MHSESKPNPKKPYLELIPLKPGVSATRPTYLEVLLRVHAPELEARPHRPLMNLALVLDRSGSMSGQKLDYAKEAAIYAVHSLLPEDRVAVVAYDNEVQVLVPSTPAADRPAIAARIRSLRPGGSTALHAGWLEGATQVAAFQEAGRTNRVILLSDGLANQGETHPQVIASQVRGLAQRGVSTSTLGVGLDYNEDLMSAMADAGEGNYYFVESPADLPRIFAQELSGLAGTLGTRVRLRLTPAAGGTVRLCNDLEQDLSGAYVLPNLIAGMPLEFLLALGAPAAAEVPLRLSLTWETPSGAQEQLEATLRLPVLEDVELERLPTHPEVSAMVAKLEATRARQQAMEALAQGDLWTARTSLLRATSRVAEHGPALATEAEELRLALLDLEASPTRTRKTLSSQVYRDRKGRKES